MTDDEDTKLHLSVDPASRIVVRTRATGMLARLAHDLQIEANVASGEAHVEGEAWTATLAIASADLRVVGTLHHGELDRGVLGAADRAEIERRMRADATPAREIVVRASGSTWREGEANVDTGRRPAAFPVRLTVRSSGGRYEVTARSTLHLGRLGVPEIKGPLGAFKLADAVEVEAELVLVPS